MAGKWVKQNQNGPNRIKYITWNSLKSDKLTWNYICLQHKMI